MTGYNTRKNAVVDTCSKGDGKIFSLIDLAIEAAGAKSLKDMALYKKIRPILLEHRVNVEADLRKNGFGVWPSPHVVMDKLLGLTPDYMPPP